MKDLSEREILVALRKTYIKQPDCGNSLADMMFVANIKHVSGSELR